MTARQNIEPISNLLNTIPNLIYRVEEWAKVFFVCVRGFRPTFVSKKKVHQREKEMEAIAQSSNFEFVQGNEQHSSSWGKFYVKGLEKWEVKEDFEENLRDKHHSYQGFVCLDVPDNTIFTIFEQSGDKHGTDSYYFFVCRSDSSIEKEKMESDYGSGFLEGSYEIIAEGKGKTKAPRLMRWWIDSERKDLEFARHCGEYIKKRGVKELPAL